MTESLTQRNARHSRERVETLWQIATLDVQRHLMRSGADHLEQAEAWASLAEEAKRRAEQQGAFARADGASYAEVARALHMTRQSARTKYEHLEVVS